MPLNIPVGQGVAAIRMRYGSDPEDMICTLGVRALTAPLDQSHALHIRDSWKNSILLQQSSAITLLGVTLRVRQDGGGDLVFDAGPTTGNTGNLTFTGIAPNVAMLVHKHTGRAGRRGRGRMYVPGITEDRVDQEGDVETASLTAINTELNDFLNLLGDDTTGGGVIPVLFHDNESDTVVTHPSPTQRVVTRTTGAAGPLPDDITGFTCDPRVATQRRRLR